MARTFGSRIKFHENSKTYYWSPASRIVTDERGLFVADECYNLEQARKRVRKG